MMVILFSAFSQLTKRALALFATGPVLPLRPGRTRPGARVARDSVG